MDICIYHKDGSGSIIYHNVIDIYIDEGKIYLKCFCTDLGRNIYFEDHCWYISDVKSIEVLRIYDYRYL